MDTSFPLESPHPAEGRSRQEHRRGSRDGAGASSQYCWITTGLGELTDDVLTAWGRLALHPVSQPFVPIQCYRHFGPAAWSMDIHRLYCGEELMAVVPLLRRHRVFRVWRAPAHNEVGRVNLALAGDEVSLMGRLLDHLLAGEAEVLEMPYVTADAPIYSGLKEAAAERGLTFIEDHVADVPLKRLAAGWETFWASLGAKTRREFARRERQMEKAGRLEFAEIRAADSLGTIFSECLEVEASGYKGAMRTALRFREVERAFWHDLAFAAAEAGSLSLYTLRLDGRLVSFDLCLKCNGVIYEMKHGTDVRAGHFSPGSVLHLKIFRHEVESGQCHLYDFSGKDYAWKQRWTKETTPLYKLRIYDPSWRGRTAYVVGPGIRRTIKRLPGASRLVSALRNARKPRRPTHSADSGSAGT